MQNETTNYIKSFLYYFSVCLAILILSTTLLSMLSDTSWRYLKMLDFPRIQYFVFGGIVLALFIWITEKWKWYDYSFAVMILLSMILQSTYLVNYTPLVAKSVPDSNSPEDGLKLLVYNVYLENEKYDEALNMLNKSDADILVILETTSIWEKKLSSLKEKYPFTSETVNEVGYGMTIFSNIPMQDIKKYYLRNESVPSYSFKIKPKNMPQVQVYSVHPPPPKHFEEMPDNVGQKEKALTMIGKRIKEDNSPVIVVGDLNDIAWGDTNELMKAGNKLRDVRVGRGFYNTFSAHNFLMKWPLDHAFVSEHFTLKRIELFDNAGSDHYPFFVELNYEK